MNPGEIMYIASINLRINVDIDKENSWVYRKKSMIDFIKEQKFDVIGCQEASPLMVQDLQDGLSDFYHFIFQPRDARGEGTPILYKKDLNFLEQGTFWLSDTPDKESIVKGSHFPRICTYARFNDFIFFNTHLDYVSDDVCLIQANHLIDSIKKITNSEGKIIVTGDFNVYPQSQTIQKMNQYFTHDYKNDDVNKLSFHGFTEEIKGDPIDYIFHTKNIKTSNLTIHRNKEKGKYLSDHYPISVYINI